MWWPWSINNFQEIRETFLIIRQHCWLLCELVSSIHPRNMKIFWSRGSTNYILWGMSQISSLFWFEKFHFVMNTKLMIVLLITFSQNIIHIHISLIKSFMMDGSLTNYWWGHSGIFPEYISGFFLLILTNTGSSVVLMYFPSNIYRTKQNLLEKKLRSWGIVQLVKNKAWKKQKHWEMMQKWND